MPHFPGDIKLHNLGQGPGMDIDYSKFHLVQYFGPRKMRQEQKWISGQISINTVWSVKLGSVALWKSVGAPLNSLSSVVTFIFFTFPDE